MRNARTLALILLTAAGLVGGLWILGCTSRTNGVATGLSLMTVDEHSAARQAPASSRRQPAGETPLAPMPAETRARTEAEPLDPYPNVHDKQSEPWNRESYDHIEDNPFCRVTDRPLSTFSIDVDTASYANLRRMLSAGQLPPTGAVRIEELVNYFRYDYDGPTDEHPFAAHVAVTDCPWEPSHRLARIALKGREIPDDQRPGMNLVFLLDVSGSMNSPNKLGLLKKAMNTLLKKLDERDRVAIAVYAGASGLALDSRPCTGLNKSLRIKPALNRLRAGGSTNGGAGIRLAYNVARKHFIEGGINRVILCTDGDFNVGTTDRGSLVNLVAKRAKEGVFLTVLGFGMGNYNDAMLEEISNKGNGNYGYVDSLREAEKMLYHEMVSNLVTIAKDVKIQIEFNPAKVAAYRLIGYENRMLRKEDFNDDKKDAGEIGAGHTVTALYELVPAGSAVPGPGVDPLKYQTPSTVTPAAVSDELLTLKLRYKKPLEDRSTLMTCPVTDPGATLDAADEDLRFAVAVASFGMILRDSPHRGSYTLSAVEELASTSLGDDPHGYRAELIELVRHAQQIAQR